MDLKFNPKAVLLARLSEEELPDLANFDCGDAEMNRFLQEEAYEEQDKGLNSTILLYYEGILAAFCSVCCDSIPLSDTEREDGKLPPYKIPSIKIARLGRDVRYRGLSFGKFLVDYCKDMAYELAKSKLGIRFLTLDSYPNRVDYYGELGFIKNEAINKSRTFNLSMRADIFD